MAFTGDVITIAGLMMIEFPARTVRLCDGGFVDFDAGGGAGLQRFESSDAVFGTIAAVDDIVESFGDNASSGGFALYPPANVPLADILDPKFQFSRVRFWQVQIGADMKSVTESELLLDAFIDVVSFSPSRGQRRLSFSLIGRDQRLFLTNEGNVASSRFHQKIWPGERGFDNCTDLVGFVAWGAAAPARSASGVGSGAGSGGNRGGNGFSTAFNAV